MKTLRAIIITFMALAGFNAYALPIIATSGSDFTVEYDAIGGDPVASVDGLSASVRYYDFAFTYNDGTDFTTMSFNFDVTNDSADPVLTSRISTLGFSTTPDIYYAGSYLSGLYSVIDGGNVPNQGVVDFCFTDVNCAGGGAGGVDIGDTAIGSAQLLFSGEFSEISFDNFTVRYQDVTCDSRFTGICPNSASGSAIVPEPDLLVLLAVGLIGIGVSRRRLKA